MQMQVQNCNVHGGVLCDVNDLVCVGDHLAQRGAALAAPGEDAGVVVERVQQPEPDGERPRRGRGVGRVQVGPGVRFRGGRDARVSLEDEAVLRWPASGIWKVHECGDRVVPECI